MSAKFRGFIRDNGENMSIMKEAEEVIFKEKNSNPGPAESRSRFKIFPRNKIVISQVTNYKFVITYLFDLRKTPVIIAEFAT
jgi:hypothetical protein